MTDITDKPSSSGTLFNIFKLKYKPHKFCSEIQRRLDRVDEKFKAIELNTQDLGDVPHYTDSVVKLNKYDCNTCSELHVTTTTTEYPTESSGVHSASESLSSEETGSDLSVTYSLIHISNIEPRPAVRMSLSLTDLIQIDSVRGSQISVLDVAVQTRIKQNPRYATRYTKSPTANNKLEHNKQFADKSDRVVKRTRMKSEHARRKSPIKSDHSVENQIAPSKSELRRLYSPSEIASRIAKEGLLGLKWRTNRRDAGSLVDNQMYCEISRAVNTPSEPKKTVTLYNKGIQSVTPSACSKPVQTSLLTNQMIDSGTSTNQKPDEEKPPIQHHECTRCSASKSSSVTVESSLRSANEVLINRLSSSKSSAYQTILAHPSSSQNVASHQSNREKTTPNQLNFKNVKLTENKSVTYSKKSNSQNVTNKINLSQPSGSKPANHRTDKTKSSRKYVGSDDYDLHLASSLNSVSRTPVSFSLSTDNTSEQFAYINELQPYTLTNDPCSQLQVLMQYHIDAQLAEYLELSELEHVDYLTDQFCPHDDILEKFHKLAVSCTEEYTQSKSGGLFDGLSLKEPYSKLIKSIAKRLKRHFINTENSSDDIHNITYLKFAQLAASCWSLLKPYESSRLHVMRNVISVVSGWCHHKQHIHDWLTEQEAWDRLKNYNSDEISYKQTFTGIKKVISEVRGRLVDGVFTAGQVLFSTINS